MVLKRVYDQFTRYDLCQDCNMFILQEVTGVFGNYGIVVDSRHLSLIADYMTLTGVVKAFDRGYMATSASPFQKMTYETTTNFMRDAIISGK